MNRNIVGVRVIDLGLIGYKKCLTIQERIAGGLKKLYASKEKTSERNCLLLLEHHPVYTIGIRDKLYPAKSEEDLKLLGAEFFRTNRGGLITFHGPGQLVAYPILHLENFKKSIRWYISSLESTVIDACARVGIQAATSAVNPGVWVGDKKICAVGVHAGRYVTTHGVGLNCNVDLEWFDHIVPCGIEGMGVTSLSEERKLSTTVDEMKPAFVNSFEKTFGCKTEDADLTSVLREFDCVIGSVR